MPVGVFGTLSAQTAGCCSERSCVHARVVLLTSMPSMGVPPDIPAPLRPSTVGAVGFLIGDGMSCATFSPWPSPLGGTGKMVVAVHPINRCTATIQGEGNANDRGQRHTNTS